MHLGEADLLNQTNSIKSHFLKAAYAGGLAVLCHIVRRSAITSRSPPIVLGLNVSQISRIETGRHGIRLKNMTKCFAAYSAWGKHQDILLYLSSSQPNVPLPLVQAFRCIAMTPEQSCPARLRRVPRHRSRFRPTSSRAAKSSPVSA
jgi:hypothetical protein